MLSSIFAAASKQSASVLLTAGIGLSLFTFLFWAVTVVVLLISIVAAYEVLSRPPAMRTPGVDVNQQSEEVEPGVRRRRFINGTAPLLGYEVPQTTYDVFTRGMEVSNDGDCLGWRERDDSFSNKLSNKFTWLRYSQVRQRAHNFGAGILDTGLLKPAAGTGNGDDACFIGIYAKNSIEWYITAHACAAYRLVPVPLYDTLGIEAVGFILKQVRMTVMVVDSEASVQKMLKADGEGNGPVKLIICVDPVLGLFVKQIHTQPVTPDSPTVAQCKERGIQFCSFAEMEKNGSASNREPQPVKPDDLYMICYTSGTTGDPKGVMITHRAVTACLRQCLECFLPFKPDPGDPIVSYLPLAHLYEHLVNLATLINGCKIGIYSGNILNLVDDMQVLHPTMMGMVPRILNRLYQKTMTSVRGNVLASILLRVALYFKIREIRQGYYRRNSIWDFLVFRRLQKTLGGQLAFFTVGSAPVAGKVRDFICASLGLPALEGYGQTESTGAVTFTLMQDDQPGQAGPPTSGVLIKLIDVSELDYNVARDGTGEILIKSPSLMVGYFRDEARTREAIDEDGWLHTGDIGRWSARGALQIVDRKKHLFKLAQGEYVAPEKVENVLQQCKAVTVIFVDGDPLETFAVAVVAPDVECVKKWYSTQSQNAADLSTEEINRLCIESAPLRKYITEELLKYGKNNGLNSIEIPKRILVVAPDAFSVENGMLTPTMKLKRPDVRKKYKAALRELYELPE